jgi:uncharacterized protein (TIGR00369 family)
MVASREDDVISDTSPDGLSRAGWTRTEVEGYLEHIGPLWDRFESDHVTCGFVAAENHKNRVGIVHGGMLATLADRALGVNARLKDPSRRHATIQLNIQYIDAARLGDFVTATARVLRETRTLCFLAGEIVSNGRLIAHISAIFRLQEARKE